MRNGEDDRPYVMHLRLEHRRINAMVRSVLVLLPPRAHEQEAAWFGSRLRERLAALRADLARHFAEEEQGGCVEEAVSRCPSLSPAAAELEAQHHVLLSLLDSIILDVRAAVPALESLGQMRRMFLEFVEQLSAHEAGESRILQRAFGAGPDAEEETGWPVGAVGAVRRAEQKSARR